MNFQVNTYNGQQINPPNYWHGIRELSREKIAKLWETIDFTSQPVVTQYREKFVNKTQIAQTFGRRCNLYDKCLCIVDNTG